MSLGVHFALSQDDYERIRAIHDPYELVEFITEEIEDRYLTERVWSYESDKAWDAIHRCLTDGRLLYASGPFPLAYAVLGGEALDAGDDYTACLVDATQVQQVAEALTAISESWLRARFDTLDRTDYQGARDEDDFEYTWTNFEGLRDFFLIAARNRRAVLFTTDV